MCTGLQTAPRPHTSTRIPIRRLLQAALLSRVPGFLFLHTVVAFSLLVPLLGSRVEKKITACFILKKCFSRLALAPWPPGPGWVFKHIHS